MNRWTKISLYVATALITGLLGKKIADGVYFEERADLIGKIASHTDFIKGANKEIKRSVRQRADFDELVNRTLGGDRESVDHQLRTRLNRIGEELEITGLTVGTEKLKELQSPAYKEFSQKITQVKYRNEIDFHELQGWISGQTTYENALRLIHRIDAEPWLKHIDQVKLQPKDNGSRFAVTIRLTTLFLPNKSPKDPVYEPYDSATFDQYLVLAQSNMFRVPPKPQPNVPEPTQIAQQVPKTSPYQAWSVTGVAIGPNGPEVWLRNPQTGESQSLSVGETFKDLLLVGAAGEEAEFKLNDKHFTVSIGQRLNQRSPLKH
ncbi:MAG: hypothetical protein IH984_02075 [Planctomycetes bacterium]|nr:hypothetical protein [Planctomycetota bacterium]